MTKRRNKEGESFEFEWDPIKYAKDGKQAQAVIWSTNVLNAAVDGIQKGLPLKANPFCGKDTQLLKPDLVFRRTEEELEEAAKCMEDPVYFASKCYLMQPWGLDAVTLRDYQVDYLHHLQHNNFSVFLSCRQSGKCLSFTTRILVKLTNISTKTIEYFKSQHYICNIDNNTIYAELPMFELYNLYCKQTLIWKLRYFLYKKLFNCLMHSSNLQLNISK